MRAANKMKKRNWLIDGLRTLSVLMMIYYHFLFDLEFFYGKEMGLFEGYWPPVRIFFAGLFLFLSGYSTCYGTRQIRNGCILVGWGFLITLVTGWFTPGRGVYFGILHLMGVAQFLSYFIFRHLLPCQNFLFVLGAWFLLVMNFHYPVYLLPLGGGGQYFSMVDYFPVVPWIIPFVLGVSAGQWKILDSFVCNYGKTGGWISWMSRHSLLVYLVHQPILFAFLWLYFGH